MTIDELEPYLDEDSDAIIHDVRLADGVLTIFLQFDDWKSDGRLSCVVACSDLATWTVTTGWVGCIHQTDDDPVLWTHNEELRSLYFSSAPVNPFELSGRLREALAALYHPCSPPSGLLHASAEILAGGSGMLACGPRSVIEPLRKVAEPFVACSVVPGRTQVGGYKLLDFGRGYVVCRSIELVRINETAELAHAAERAQRDRSVSP